MKGLYGMLGLEYRDEDSEEEEGGGGAVREPRDVIQITDDEEAGDKKMACDKDEDMVVVDLGGKNTNKCARNVFCKLQFRP